MQKKIELELEHKILRIRDRIRDVEWQIEQCSQDAKEREGLNAERHRAIDKLRHLQDDLYKHKVDNVGEADET